MPRAHGLGAGGTASSRKPHSTARHCCTAACWRQGECLACQPVPAVQMQVCLLECQLCLLRVFSVLPAIERSSSKEGKRRTVRQRREKTEIPACKGHQRVGQVRSSLVTASLQ